MSDRKVLKEFGTDGYSITILEAKGADARQFMQMKEAGAGNAEMQEVLACRTTLLDGKPVTQDMLADLPMRVYIEIMKAQMVNFTSTDL